MMLVVPRSTWLSMGRCKLAELAEQVGKHRTCDWPASNCDVMSIIWCCSCANFCCDDSAGGSGGGAVGSPELISGCCFEVDRLEEEDEVLVDDIVAEPRSERAKIDEI